MVEPVYELEDEANMNADVQDDEEGEEEEAGHFDEGKEGSSSHQHPFVMHCQHVSIAPRVYVFFVACARATEAAAGQVEVTVDTSVGTGPSATGVCNRGCTTHC